MFSLASRRRWKQGGTASLAPLKVGEKKKEKQTPTPHKKFCVNLIHELKCSILVFECLHTWPFAESTSTTFGSAVYLKQQQL